MTHYFNACKDQEPFATMFPEDDDARKDFIKSLHLRKTDLFLDIVQVRLRAQGSGKPALPKSFGANVTKCSSRNRSVF